MLPLEAISGFVMLTNIKPPLFILIRDPQPNDHINHFKDDRGHDKGKDPGSSHGEKLGPELARISEKEAVRSAGVDQFAGKKAGGQSPPCSSQPMDPEHVEGVIITKFRFYHDAAVADDTDQSPDDKGRYRTYEPRAWWK